MVKIGEKKMNLNNMAKRITLKEGGKRNLNIGDVKEVMKLIFQTLAKLSIWEIGSILKKYKR